MTREERIEKAKSDHGIELVIYGTGYPIRKPHILVVNDYVDAYPEGDNGLGGMGMGLPRFDY